MRLGILSPALLLQGGGSGENRSPERRRPPPLLPRLAAAQAATGSLSGRKEGGGGAPPPLLSLLSSPSPSLGGWPVHGVDGFSRRPTAGSASHLAGSAPSTAGFALPEPMRGGAQPGAAAAPAAGSRWGTAATALAAFTVASTAWVAEGAQLWWLP
jgi:hypothetical protein